MQTRITTLAAGIAAATYLTPLLALAAPPEVLRGFDNSAMPTRLYNGAQNFGVKTFSMNTRTWSSSWTPLTTTFPGSYGHMVPLRWLQKNTSLGHLERHDVFAVEYTPANPRIDQVFTFHPQGSSAPAVTIPVQGMGAFFAKTGFTQEDPWVKNLFGTDARGDNLYTPAPQPTPYRAKELIEFYWEPKAGWKEINRGAPQGAEEFLLGPEGAVWEDGEALVCMSIPGDVVCRTFTDHAWYEYDLPDIEDVTLLQAPVVIEYDRLVGDPQDCQTEHYFRVLVVGWNPYLNAGAGEWHLYSIERNVGNPWLWGSESGVSTWHDFGPAPNVPTPVPGFPGDPEDTAFSLTAYSEFSDSCESWVNVFGTDEQGTEIVDFYYGGWSTPRSWQWGGGQNTPETGFEISSAVGQVDASYNFRVSAFGVGPSGQIYERYFDEIIPGGWNFLAL